MYSLIIKTKKGNFVNDFGEHFDKGFAFDLRFNKITVYNGIQQSLQKCFELIQTYLDIHVDRSSI